MSFSDMRLNCPVCGQEMEYGEVAFNLKNGLIWMPEGIKTATLKKYLRSYHFNRSFVAGSDDASFGINSQWVLEPMDVTDWYIRLPSHICRACKEVLIHYNERREYRE